MHPILLSIGPFLIPAYGALASIGVLAAIFLAQYTAKVAKLDTAKIWTLCVAVVFASLVASRLLLLALNWTELRLHPRWMLGLAMIHHPLLAAVGALAGLVAGVAVAIFKRLPLRATADALAAPIALGLAIEQVGALMAGSGYGIPVQSAIAARWAVVYSSNFAALWSGTPLFLPLHPVQAYLAISLFFVSLLLLLWLRWQHRSGDIAGIGLLATSVAVYCTEFWRDAEGRGQFLSGAIDGPQLAAIALVLAAACILLEAGRTPEARQ